MICPNCQMQQPQNNLAYCVRCNYPLQNRPQGFFAKSSQTGYSKADVYSAARRGQPVQQQQYKQISYPAQQQNTGNVQIMYDANGNQIYVQVMYDRTGKPVYVQMIPKIVGRDASGNPVYTMVPASQAGQLQSQQLPQSQQYQQTQKKQPAFLDTVSETSSKENAEFIPRNGTKPPPVPVMPRPGEQPAGPVVSVPDRPAMRASTIASSMYAANQPQQSNSGTGSFFARMQQQKLQQQNSVYDAPVNAEELLREEARTAFVPDPPADENAVLKRIFETKSKEYEMNTGRGNSTFAVDVAPDEVENVSEKNLYKPAEKSALKTQTPKPLSTPKKPEPKPEPKPETKEQKNDGLNKLFRSKKQKEKPKHKTIIVDPDEIFGDSKKHKVEMLGVTIDGDEKAVNAKLKEIKESGKKSVRSMIDADVSIESMVDDPLSGDAARRALTDEVIQQAYDSVESAEIAKALEQLNQGIFPKSTK